MGWFDTIRGKEEEKDASLDIVHVRVCILVCTKNFASRFFVRDTESQRGGRFKVVAFFTFSILHRSSLVSVWKQNKTASCETAVWEGAIPLFCTNTRGR